MTEPRKKTIKSIYMFKVEYLLENGFTPYIYNVDFHYRRVFNSCRVKGAYERYLEQFSRPPRGKS